MTVRRKLHHAAGMDDGIPVIVRMRIECAKCGHAEDDSYEFDLPRAKAQPRKEYVADECPECGAPILMHLKRTQQRQWPARAPQSPDCVSSSRSARLQI